MKPENADKGESANLPPIHAPAGSSDPKSAEMKKCPFCAEMILGEAIKCRYCGSDLSSSAETSRTRAPLNIRSTADEIALAARPPVMRSGRSADQTQSAMQTPATGYAPRVVTLGDSGSRRGVKTFLGIAVGILMCYVVLLTIFGERTSSSPERTRVTIGHEALVTDGLIFVSESGVREAQSVAHKDLATRERALVAMMMGGQMLGVGKGTRVMVVERRSGDVFQVRVMEGEMIGRVGYLPENLLSPKD